MEKVKIKVESITAKFRSWGLWFMGPPRATLIRENLYESIYNIKFYFMSCVHNS